MVSSGFTDGNGKSVQFVKDGENYIFKMVIKDEFLNDKSMENVFNVFPKELSDAMDLPLDMHLCDDSFKMLRIHKLARCSKINYAKSNGIAIHRKCNTYRSRKIKKLLNLVWFLGS